MTKDTSYSLEAILGKALPREEALQRIRLDPETYRAFQNFPHAEQERILSFVQGNQGLRIMHDSFAQKVLNPKTNPERLESLLSAILGDPVRICDVLTREGCQISDAGSLVIMDFLVTLSDGSTVNVEIQHVGYLFPGERAGCYLSDLLMRQYSLTRSEKGRAFSYRDMKPVCLIVIMEQSSDNFLAAAPHYIHREQHTYDTGAKTVNLFKTIYISLDTFHAVVHNIDTKLHAWLTFLSSDQPADIVKLVNAHPEFIPLYQDIVEFRRHPKELITMFSDALAILDHNTELYMIDEAKKQLEELRQSLSASRQELSASRQELSASRQELSASRQELSVSRQALSETEQALSETEQALTSAIAALRDTGKTDEEIQTLLHLTELPKRNLL